MGMVWKAEDTRRTGGAIFGRWGWPPRRGSQGLAISLGIRGAAAHSILHADPKPVTPWCAGLPLDVD